MGLEKCIDIDIIPSSQTLGCLKRCKHFIHSFRLNGIFPNAHKRDIHFQHSTRLLASQRVLGDTSTRLKLALKMYQMSQRHAFFSECTGTKIILLVAVALLLGCCLDVHVAVSSLETCQSCNAMLAYNLTYFHRKRLKRHEKRTQSQQPHSALGKHRRKKRTHVSRHRNVFLFTCEMRLNPKKTRKTRIIVILTTTTAKPAKRIHTHTYSVITLAKRLNNRVKF